jgi:hypothetical protein
MRRVITGLDANGRSCVVSDELIDTTTGRATGGRDKGTLSVLWRADEFPPVFDRPRDFPLLDTGSTLGSSRWLLLGWEPNVLRTTVRTNTLDYDTVLEGSCELILENGSVWLGVGDSVMIPGTVHRWRSGPEGVVMSVVVIGLDDD